MGGNKRKLKYVASALKRVTCKGDNLTICLAWTWNDSEVRLIAHCYCSIGFMPGWQHCTHQISHLKLSLKIVDTTPRSLFLLECHNTVLQFPNNINLFLCGNSLICSDYKQCLGRSTFALPCDISSWVVTWHSSKRFSYIACLSPR